jgi:tetratricopeptide (TPR) repeat protein
MDAQTRVAGMLGKLGKMQEAHAHLARLRNSFADEASIVHLHMADGDLYRLNNEFKKAYEHYTIVLKTYPKNIDILYARAMIGEKLERIDWLERDLTAIIELEPKNATALNALGYTLADHSKNLPQAFKYIKRALSIRPDDAAILDSMGWVHFRMGNIEEAEKYLSKALSILEDPEIAGHLSEVLWLRGEHQKAIEIVNKALKASPEDNRLLKLQDRFVQ